MSYLASFQESVQLVPQWAPLFPPHEQIQWLELEKFPVTVTNWPDFTVALQELFETVQNWPDRGASMVYPPQAAIELLERLYTFRQRAEVLGFLDRHSFLVSLLLEAYNKIRNHFPHSQVFLEVISDPEVEGVEELFAYILTSLPIDEALARLDSLDEEWFLDQLDRVGGRFNFNLEFA